MSDVEASPRHRGYLGSDAEPLASYRRGPDTYSREQVVGALRDALRDAVTLLPVGDSPAILAVAVKARAALAAAEGDET